MTRLVVVIALLAFIPDVLPAADRVQIDKNCGVVLVKAEPAGTWQYRVFPYKKGNRKFEDTPLRAADGSPIAIGDKTVLEFAGDMFYFNTSDGMPKTMPVGPDGKRMTPPLFLNENKSGHHVQVEGLFHITGPGPVVIRRKPCDLFQVAMPKTATGSIAAASIKPESIRVKAQDGVTHVAFVNMDIYQKKIDEVQFKMNRESTVIFANVMESYLILRGEYKDMGDNQKGEITKAAIANYQAELYREIAKEVNEFYEASLNRRGLGDRYEKQRHGALVLALGGQSMVMRPENLPFKAKPGFKAGLEINAKYAFVNAAQIHFGMESRDIREPLLRECLNDSENQKLLAKLVAEADAIRPSNERGKKEAIDRFKAVLVGFEAWVRAKSVQAKLSEADFQVPERCFVELELLIDAGGYYEPSAALKSEIDAATYKKIKQEFLPALKQLRENLNFDR
jgi:hypothetical protein